VRPGLCDFVPIDGTWADIGARQHPALLNCLREMRSAGFESLLDERRLLALMQLSQIAAERSPGALIELGVYKGGGAAAVSWNLRKRRILRPFHLCDTFRGLPKPLDWEVHYEADFNDTDVETVSNRLRSFIPEFPYEFHQGFFSETLPALSETTFCFAHVDADLYSSVMEACEFLYPRIPRGGIIVFDDYGAPTCPGAKKAVDEFFAKRLETPTHVAQCAYGVMVGEAEIDFQRLLATRVLPAALARAVVRTPLRIGGREVLRISEKLAVPERTKRLAAPLLPRNAQAAKSEPNVASARSILVVRGDAIGDLVLTSPFLRELRRSNPDAWITLVTDSRFVSLVELCPYVNEVLPFDPHYAGRFGKLGQHGKALALARKYLWKRKFDLALLPRWDADYYESAFVGYFSGAPWRAGYAESVSGTKRRVNRGYDTLLTRAFDDHEVKHEVERSLDFLRKMGGNVREDRLELWLSAEDREAARKALVSRGLTPGDTLVAIAPGAGVPKRVWRLGRFIEVGCALTQELGAHLLILGAKEDGAAAARLKEQIGPSAIDLTGEMTLRQTAALLEHATLLVANDSGPMHLGAAAGAAVLEISCHPKNGDPLHDNSPMRFRPWCKEFEVLQPTEPAAPCTDACEWHEAHCILGVSVEMALNAARRLRGTSSEITKRASGAPGG
jgi:ADP-heptose:LPS heptosyltransferase